ncbi:hypothetical protein EYS09_36160 [Streptomyces kasugaensis]|uniref:Uncharacterized protein n=1 Tax=Streptomyces kasugaensis TaxID=1946 RepID=A0A4Q9HJR3_STRKA|nr:hypothetical protein [Streptomyces kasugaensis]TBO54888.1 hypothetical protein EYS09_36160 [Streptomyces kasugaensis]
MTYRTEQDHRRRRDIADAASGYSRSRTRVVVYANVSHGDQDRIRSYLAAQAGARDWTIAAACIDVGPTALPLHQRPGWREAAKLLTTDTANGGADGLIARSAAQIADTDRDREALRNQLDEAHAFAVYLDDEPLTQVPPARREAFRVGAAVVDTTRSKVAKILAVNGECLVLSRPVGDPWDALVTWCRPATLREALSLTAIQGTVGTEGPEDQP